MHLLRGADGLVGRTLYSTVEEEVVYVGGHFHLVITVARVLFLTHTHRVTVAPTGYLRRGGGKLGNYTGKRPLGESNSGRMLLKLLSVIKFDTAKTNWVAAARSLVQVLYHTRPTPHKVETTRHPRIFLAEVVHL